MKRIHCIRVFSVRNLFMCITVIKWQFILWALLTVFKSSCFLINVANLRKAYTFLGSQVCRATYEIESLVRAVSLTLSPPQRASF